MKITDVQASYLEVPFPKIRKIGRLPPLKAVPITLVRIGTDEGITGIGAAGYGYGYRRLLRDFVNDELKPLLLGKDPFTVGPLFDQMLGKFMPWCSGMIQRLSAVEIALWDIIGKAANQPIYKLLGGYNTKIKAFCSTYLWRTPEEHAREAVEIVNQGFRAIKLRGGRPHRATDLAVVKAVRDAVGPNIDIMLDPICAYSRREARRMARKLEKYELAFLEEPLPPEDLEGLAELARSVDVPIAGGENYYDLPAFKAALTAGALDILQPDVTRAGGILNTRKIAAVAEAWNKPVTPHSGTLLAETLQLLGAIPNTLYVEFSLAVRPVRDALLQTPITVRDGYIDVPDGPGLGVTLNDATVAKYTQQ